MLTITSLSYSGARYGARLAIIAACTPFGSLDSPDSLADSMLDWLDVPSPEAVACVEEILATPSAEQWTTAAYEATSVVLTTPTSSTRIRLSRAGADYSVCVTFPTPSRERALSILGAARRKGVTLVAQSHRATLSAEQVRQLLLEKAQSYAAWLDGLEPGYYPADVLPGLKAAAADTVQSLST